MARSLTRDRRCRERVDAVLSRIDSDRVELMSDPDVEALLRTVGEREALPRGGVEGRARDKQLIALARLGDGEVFPGYAFAERRSGRRERQRNGVLCHTALEVQSAVGCPFDCTYCPYTHFVCARLDVKHIVDRVTALARSRPAQRLFKLNNRSDTLGLEPEAGLARALVERFAELEGRQLMLYEKGDAVEHLLCADHRGHTVASFTLTPEPVADLLETGAPSPDRRIEAIRRLAVAGYPVRVRLSPIVPVRGYREAYASLIDRLLAAAAPEMITLWTLSMIDIEELDRIVPLDVLDEDILAESRAAADAMRGRKGAPFPPAVRAKIYEEVAGHIRRSSPTTEVALCLETPPVWDGVAGWLTPRTGGRFLCNCGPRATSDALVPLRRRRAAGA